MTCSKDDKVNGIPQSSIDTFCSVFPGMGL